MLVVFGAVAWSTLPISNTHPPQPLQCVEKTSPPPLSNNRGPGKLSTEIFSGI